MSIGIGEIIRYYRMKLELSQTELAEKLHVSSQAVSKWENGSSRPSINQLPLLAAVLGRKIDEFFVFPIEFEYERIKNTIERGVPIANDVFINYESILVGEIEKNPENTKAFSLLSSLYMFESQIMADKAQYYSKYVSRI